MKGRSGQEALLFFGLIATITFVLRAMTQSHILLCLSVPVMIAILICIIAEE